MTCKIADSPKYFDVLSCSIGKCFYEQISLTVSDCKTDDVCNRCIILF